MAKNIPRIIETIDRYLEIHHKAVCDPVEANEYLERMGVLRDSNSRKGKPLREILRDGLIPHAYQGSKGGWSIPHSGKHSSQKLNKIDKTEIPEESKKPKVETRTLSFPPLLGEKPEILILGTLPGKKSLELNQYYGNSGNRFWAILAVIFNEDEPIEYEDKKAFLFRHHIALWDVAHSAIRPGSADVDITEEIINPIEDFLIEYPTIKVIGFNGKAAQEKFLRNIKVNSSKIRLVLLKSSSPANCQYSFETMVADWHKLIDK